MTTSSYGSLTMDSPPDLSEILDKIDFDKQPLAHNFADREGRFGVAKWGALIIEMLAYPDEKEEILQHFGLTPNQYAKLKGNPLFQSVYEEVKSQIVSLAATNGFQLSARRLAEQGLNTLEDIMANGEKDSDRINAARAAFQMANLDPLVQAKQQKEGQASSTGVQLVVNFSPNMPMPAAFKGQQGVVIDTKAEVVNVQEIEQQ